MSVHHPQYSHGGAIPNYVINNIRYDMIRDAILTCARKPTWVSLIYRTETTTKKCKNTHTHTHPFNGSLSGTTQVSRYQKGKTNLDFTEARDSEWQWHQLGCVQVCTLLQTDKHASTPPLKKCKNRKTKSRKQICSEITVNSPGNPCSEKDLQKRKPGMKEWVGDGIPVSMTVGR